MGTAYQQGFTVRHGQQGRSRRPGGLFDQHPISVKETATTVTVVAAATDLSANLTSETSVAANAGENGYKTYNARYLHVLVRSDGTTDPAEDVYVYGYNYNFGEWAPLLAQNKDGTFTQMEAVTSTTDDAPLHYIFEIAGVDRVAFVHGGTGALGDITCKAAANTF